MLWHHEIVGSYALSSGMPLLSACRADIDTDTDTDTDARWCRKGIAVPMLEIAQELMTPHEAARWFRRSASWLRQQGDLVKLGGPNGQPLYHTHACRAFVYGRMCDLEGEPLRKVQLDALAAACGVLVEHRSQDPEASTPPREHLLQLHACSDSGARQADLPQRNS